MSDFELDPGLTSKSFAADLVADTNTALNADEQMGFLLPGQFKHEDDLRLLEMPTDVNVTEGE